MGKTEALWKFLCRKTQPPSLHLMAFCPFIKVKYKSNEKTQTLFLVHILLSGPPRKSVYWDGIPKPTLHLPSTQPGCPYT